MVSITSKTGLETLFAALWFEIPNRGFFPNARCLEALISLASARYPTV